MMDNNTRKFYDFTADRTAKEWYSKKVLMPTLRDFLSLLPKNPRVLDLGCGPGYESMRLRHLGATVVGIDFSRESVRIAQGRNPNCTFIEMDFFNIDESLGVFHGVFASGSLIHVPQKKVKTLAKVLKGVMHKDAYWEMILQKGTGKRLSSFEVEGEKIERVIYLHDLKDLKKSLEECGYRYIREGELDISLKKYGWRCYIFKNTGHRSRVRS